MATSGEEPFANLVRKQFQLQPPRQGLVLTSPNEGRKALLFSDGRQRAARLARDLPRAVELESFRNALLLAWCMLFEHNPVKASLALRRIYIAFVAVCSETNLSFFDDEDGSHAALLSDILNFREEYDCEIESALDTEAFTSVPIGFRKALFRQLYDQRESLFATCIAVPSISSPSWNRFVNRVRRNGILDDDVKSEQDLRLDVIQVISQLISTGMIDKDLGDIDRQLIDPYWTITPLDTIVISVPNVKRKFVEEIAASSFMTDGYLNLPDLSLHIAIDEDWIICNQCGHIQDKIFERECLRCHGLNVRLLSADDPMMLARTEYWRRPVRAALNSGRFSNFSVEEHSAQLSYRDKDKTYATTEEHELRFLDVPIGKKGSIDVLSSTTTMEVGIDIGSLTAVGLRNVPPRRDNYQQRAGRAGRRGSSISTVVTYSLNGPHDSYYFDHPDEMISGPLPRTRLLINNVRLAKRHLNAWLIQTFFHERLDAASVPSRNSGIFSSLGSTKSFFGETGPFTLTSFKGWLDLDWSAHLQQLGWLTFLEGMDIYESSKEFVQSLERLKPCQQGEFEDTSNLLDTLFDNGFLPSYAFPTDVVSLTLFDKDSSNNVIEQPQQSKVQALSEYAPGRTVVVNKKTYRIGGIYDPYLKQKGLQNLFDGKQHYVYCTQCTYVQPFSEQTIPEVCPICNKQLESMPLLDPPGFSPSEGRALRSSDTKQSYSSARRAQLPVPAISDGEWAWKSEIGKNIKYSYAKDLRLLVANVGSDSKDGFSICPKCGYAYPSDEEDEVAQGHYPPFPSKSGKCNGTPERGIALGTSILSDVLLMRISFKRPFISTVSKPLVDALWSIAEALCLAASRVLDIDTTELSSGFRFLSTTTSELQADVYLYDTASGGAGYSSDAGERLDEILNLTGKILSECTGNCDRSCNKCLRHYANQYEHQHLDRFLGYDLWDYAVNGILPSVSGARERVLTRTVEQYLKLEEGWNSRETTSGLQISRDGSQVMRNMKFFSCLMEQEKNTSATVCLSDYQVLRDLPQAIELLKR